MATRKRKDTLIDNDYSKLDEYCIWLQEYYLALMRAGFTETIARALITDKESYPEWVSFGNINNLVAKYLEDEDE